jgi:hypothetical protein
MPQRHFFGTADDLIAVFARVEREYSLSFVPTGLFETARFASLSSGTLVPTLRAPQAGSSAECATYLVTRNGTRVNVRAVPQQAGGILYAIDQLENPDSVTLTHGGLRSPGVLIAGRVATVSATPGAKLLQSAFSKAIGKLFTRVNAFYVGPAALELLDRGGRLTASEASPREYDLERPRCRA